MENRYNGVIMRRQRKFYKNFVGIGNNVEIVF